MKEINPLRPRPNSPDPNLPTLWFREQSRVYTVAMPQRNYLGDTTLLDADGLPVDITGLVEAVRKTFLNGHGGEHAIAKVSAHFKRIDAAMHTYR